jgi:dihydroorotase
MSKFFNYGMTISQIIAGATLNPSRTFPIFSRRGTLAVGAPADVALLELRTGQFEFLDNYQNKTQGQRRLFPAGTVLDGKLIQRRVI